MPQIKEKSISLGPHSELQLFESPGLGFTDPPRSHVAPCADIGNAARGGREPGEEEVAFQAEGPAGKGSEAGHVRRHTSRSREPGPCPHLISARPAPQLPSSSNQQPLWWPPWAPAPASTNLKPPRAPRRG